MKKQSYVFEHNNVHTFTPVLVSPPVLKSDNANGLFGFSGPCDPERADTEDAVFRCPIERQRGDAATVLLTWQLMQVAPPGGQQHELADADFQNVTGVMVFEPGERSKVL